MTRYFTHARGWVEDEIWSNELSHVPSLSVSDHEALYTGLLDSKGEPIYRAPNPIGFGRDREW